MWQLIKHSLDQGEDKTKWTLNFSNVTEQDIRKCTADATDSSDAQRMGRAREQTQG